MEENNETKQETSEFEEVPAYQEVEVKEKEVRTDSYFDGGVLELIGWRLLAGIISVVTLGIGIPWAQCMLYSWRLKHTVYNGKRLKFEGTGGELFVQIFKWIFFTIITLGIYLFFVPVKKAKWILSNVHYEDENFSKDESFFDGKTLGLIGIKILTKIITILSFGLLYPFAVCIKLRWINKHSVINRKKLVFDGNGIQLWGKYLLWTFFTIITFGIFGLWLPVLAMKWETKHTHIRKVGEEDKKDKSLFIIIPILILTVAIIITIVSSMEKFNFDIKNPQELFSNLFGENGIVTSAIKKDSSALEQYEDDEYEEYEDEVSTSKPGKVVSSTPDLSPTPTKDSVTVGAYTLHFGTYKGQIIQGVWDDETMTSTARYTDIILKLTETTISINGDSASYYISGSNIIWKGESYYLEATGNNTIRYNAETCPELIYQGD